MRVDVYSRHGAYVGTISGEALLSFVHTDELNGEDSVSITTTFPLSEGQRLVWSDAQGRAHEHICQDPQGVSGHGVPAYADTALNSILELFGDYIEDRRPYGYSFLRALGVCLEPTRWEPGTVDQPGTVSDGLTFYHTDCRSALNKILECGGELETEIEVGPSGVSSRKVSIRAHRGDRSGHKRFSYGKDLVSVTRTEHWGAITACYGYGKGLETGEGGYGRKLTFGDINGGLDYVEDAEALEAYGRPDGKGGLAHVFGVYENPDCTDAGQLIAETRGYLEAHSSPGVTYEADVLDLVAMGREWEGCGVGDDVQIVDYRFEPTLRCEGRVSSLVTDMLAGTRTVTLGNVTQTLCDLLASQQGQLDSLNRHSANWDVAASTPAAYLQQVVDGLNEQFNVNGMSYTFTSFEKGTIYSNVPLDEKGNPTADGWGMQLCSQGLRIASGTKPDGTFDWRTFGTGEGFTADLINAGTLNAGLVRAGVLMDATGKNYWDMSTGALRMTGLASSSEAIKSVDVEYALGDSQAQAPASGWSTTAPAWQEGRYMWQRTKVTAADGSVSYSDPTCIQGADGPKGDRGDPGDPGADGTGVSAVVEQYYLSTSEDSCTGGAWSTEQPAWQKGRYIWTRSEVTWTDGTTTHTDPVLAKAVNGANETAGDAYDKAQGLDEELDSEGVFNRLTDHGRIQGLFMEDGSLFVNAEYIKTGVLTDALGLNSWDLSTGEFHLTGSRCWYATCQTPSDTKAKVAEVDGEGFGLADGVMVLVRWSNGNAAASPTLDVGGTGALPVKIYGADLQGGTYYDWAGGSTSFLYYHDGAWNVADNAALYRASSAVRETRDLDDSLDQQEVFDRLTNQGTAKGVYLVDGELFINADYIKAGTLVAEMLGGDEESYLRIGLYAGLRGVGYYEGDVCQYAIVSRQTGASPSFAVYVPYPPGSETYVQVLNFTPQMLFASNLPYAGDGAQKVLMVDDRGLVIQRGTSSKVVASW